MTTSRYTVTRDESPPTARTLPPAYIAHALGVVARAHGISQLSKETGLTRETLYKSLSDEGNPTLSTLTKVMKAMGMQVTVQAAPSHTA